MSQNEVEKDVLPTEEEMSEFLKVRREKLAELRDKGKDPFQLTTYQVTA